ncbi:MAG: FG-GAP-like repeat [Thermoanaerobaculia bacterium]|nr:FG-GAP-like repeat [Thermoanaerobaculia bacterium]
MLFRRGLYVLFFAGLAAFAPVCLAQTDEDLALKFFPKALDDDFIANHPPDVPVARLVTPLRVDLDGTGTEDYLAAAYSNGLGGCLRVIKGAGAAATVVAETNDTAIGGRGKPVLEAVDIDHDGIPELVVEFTRASWIYRYKNGGLVLMNPGWPGASAPTSTLGNLAFADLDGDGVLEVLDYTNAASGSLYAVYRLVNGKLAVTAQNIVFFDRFERPAATASSNPQGQPTGKPAVESRRFSATAGSNYELRIVNGDQSKKSMVTAGEVRLNDVTVVSSSDFKKTQRSIAVPVKLTANNSLTVELRGDTHSDAEITLSIVPVP